MTKLSMSDWRSHSAKHQGFAGFYLQKRYQAALREVLAQTEVADQPTYARLAAMDYTQDEMPLFDEVLAKVVDDGSLMRFVDAYRRQTDRVKQLGFYVDLDDQMRVVSTPAHVTEELARDHIEFVRDVIETLRVHLGPTKPSHSDPAL
jgi:hypothetical protein